MRDLAIIVPIKALAQAKQRQASLLTPTERSGLVLAMARDVLWAVLEAVDGATLWACCGDREGAALARALGAQVLLDDDPKAGLNDIIERAAQHLDQAGWARVLVVHADLPWLSAMDIEIATQFGANEVMLIPDHRGTGTNLLGWGLHTGFIASYGEGSCERHRTRAALLNLTIQSPSLPWATLDVDCPDDLRRLLAAEPAERAVATRAWLKRSNLLERLALTPTQESR